jgi:hypothetical protein
VGAINDIVSTPINGKDGTTITGVNVLPNDKLNGVILTYGCCDYLYKKQGPLRKYRRNCSGDPNTPAGTPLAAIHVCEVLNPDNCDTATVTVKLAVLLSKR